MRRSVLALVTVTSLAIASLAGFAWASVSRVALYSRTPPENTTQQQVEAPAAVGTQGAALPVTVYPQGEDADAPDGAGLPQIVLAGMREPGRPGWPETMYGDPSFSRLVILSADGGAGAANLPEAIYAGGPASAEAGLPETANGATRMPNRAGMPEAVYASDSDDAAPTNEAVALARDADGMGRAGAVANPNGVNVETNDGHLPPPESRPSPYTHFTDAQRVGMNPCERKEPAPSPYTSLTDAQRAGETNCW